MRRVVPYVLVIGLASTPPVAATGEVFVYPEKGQSAEQQQKDEFECYNWAKAQSGVDPAAPAAGPDRQQRLRGTMGGAARGAAGGALIGAIAGDAGKGAGIGAAVGGIGGRRGARRAEQTAQAASQDAYQRAFSVCMEARGYRVG